MSAQLHEGKGVYLKAASGWGMREDKKRFELSKEMKRALGTSGPDTFWGTVPDQSNLILVKLNLKGGVSRTNQIRVFWFPA